MLKKALTHKKAETSDTSVHDRVSTRYAVSVTDHLKGAMRSTDTLNDPVARQYLPRLEELEIRPEERVDPIGDDPHSPVKGLVHRHKNRVLFMPVFVCAAYCRYCFRREVVGSAENALNPQDRRRALDYIREHSQISEVILTGGDPFVLSARKLSDLVQELAAIDHIKTIRFHTRAPMAWPKRITPEFCAAFAGLKQAVYICLHINHVQEITEDVRAAINNLRASGAMLLSQSVLLRGVNDHADTLVDLMTALTEIQIKPYYLHHPDLAPGTAHFRVSLEHGQALMRELQSRLSGLSIPRYMLDIPGGFGKVPIEPSYVQKQPDGTYNVIDHHGDVHTYVESLS